MESPSGGFAEFPPVLVFGVVAVPSGVGGRNCLTLGSVNAYHVDFTADLQQRHEAILHLFGTVIITR